MSYGSIGLIFPADFPYPRGAVIAGGDDAVSSVVHDNRTNRMVMIHWQTDAFEGRRIPNSRSSIPRPGDEIVSIRTERQCSYETILLQGCNGSKSLQCVSYSPSTNDAVFKFATAKKYPVVVAIEQSAP
jgi:hypothetical protein